MIINLLRIIQMSIFEVAIMCLLLQLWAPKSGWPLYSIKQTIKWLVWSFEFLQLYFRSFQFSTIFYIKVITLHRRHSKMKAFRLKFPETIHGIIDTVVSHASGLEQAFALVPHHRFLITEYSWLLPLSQAHDWIENKRSMK